MPRRTLPPQWAGWQSIRQLYLQGNQLSGPLPDAWGGRTFPALTTLNVVRSLHMSRLDMVQMLLHVSVVKCTCECQARHAQMLTQHVVLCQGDNNLTGTFPASWLGNAPFPVLGYMGLFLNKLTGSLPQPASPDCPLCRGQARELISTTCSHAAAPCMLLAWHTVHASTSKACSTLLDKWTGACS